MGARDLEAVGMVNVILAHMGGIDEVGIFLVPALLAIFALRWAEKRARARASSDEQPGDLNEPASSLQLPASSEEG